MGIYKSSLHFKNEVQAAFVFSFCHFRIEMLLSKHILLDIWLCGIFVIVQ